MVLGLKKIDQDSARVRVPPPVYLLASVLVGVSLHFLHPLHFISKAPRWILAALLIGAGLSAMLYCAWMFRKAQTAIEPWKTTSHLVTSGPYYWSRNPIYLSFVFVGLGLACAFNNLWIALTQLFLIIAINRFVIRKEEYYLEQKFGETYMIYKANVRRWI